MPFEKFTVEDEQLLKSYVVQRDDIRGQMGALYNLSQAVIGRYQDLAGKLEPDSEFESLSAYHTKTTAPVAPAINVLIQSMQIIIDTMIAVEKATPGLFGISVPDEAEEK